MTNQAKMALLMALYRAIFTSKAQNTDPTTMVVNSPYFVPLGNAVGRWFVNGTLRGFDFDVSVGNRVLQLRMLEQNPNKTDAAGNRTYYANLAASGHSIAWVIDRKKQTNAFLGRIQDGQWHFAKPQAVTPANSSALPRPVSEIPDIPANIGIPDYVTVSMADDEDTYGPGEYT